MFMKTSKLGQLALAGLVVVSNEIVQGQSLSIVQFISASYTVNENAGAVTLLMEEMEEPGGTASVLYLTDDGTAIHGEDLHRHQCAWPQPPLPSSRVAAKFRSHQSPDH